MNKKTTEIIFILDRSGSMRGLESDTIRGYNNFLDKQKEYQNNTLITTVLFDDRYELLYDGISLNKAYLTNKDYFVRGGTALLDAIGKTINDANSRHKKLSKEEKPDKVIFVITTDGMENASKEFTKDQIKDIITASKKHQWEFIFFGANIDTIAVADGIGINKKMAKNFTASSEGIKMMTNDLSSFIDENRK